MIAPIPVSAWREDGAAWTARIPLAPGLDGIVWIMGWDDRTASSATAGPDATPFLPLVLNACCRVRVGADGMIVLAAPLPPTGGVAIGLDPTRRPAARSMLGLPRGLATAPRRHRRAPPPDPTRVAQLLDTDDIDTLLTLLGEAMLTHADRAAIEAAARDLFLHLARHPMRRDPALGALVAALSA